MTAIAYRDGVIAADTCGWVANGRVKLTSEKKLERLPDGSVIGCMGAVSEITAVVNWLREFESGGSSSRPVLDKDEDFGCLRAFPDGKVQYAGWKLQFYDIHGPFHCIGAPAEFMFGAMFAGASAEQAVLLAILHTDSAGGNVEVEHLAPLLQDAAE